MLPIRFSAFKRYTLLSISISLNGEIISPYSYYIKKGLVCVIIISFFSYQPSFYLECTKANTHLLYNMRSVPLNKYIFFLLLSISLCLLQSSSTLAKLS